ncbi:MAG TPA: rhomboid family intramembrane serine protease [Planctomycetes bacterium]|nr:rhomboid family intramembrane serine protease [Fuerstiella sp.]HIK94387.1 rhomboid family intramembrane serine protease [Planctomycetota bacterium]
MLIPIGTDAPLYHYPIATVGLIVANVICFVAIGFGAEETLDPWVLHFGVINPIEWLSTMFAHAGFFHLIGNMFFLWGFGLVVEGKLGWRRMLTLYLAIGIAQAALIQFIMLPWNRGGAVGASSAIMGLMGVSLVWAPKNELKVFFSLFFRIFIFDVTIMWYACFYLGWELVSWTLLHGMGMSTAALHLSGALIGFGAGVLYLKKGWVDCENWDLFRVWSGNYGRYADSSTTVSSYANPELMFGKSDVAVKDDLPDDSRPKRNSKRLNRINEMIDCGDFIGASEEMLTHQLQDSDSQFNESRLKKLAIGLLRANMPDDAEIYLEEYVERFPDAAAWARVRLAQVLLVHHKRPSAALAELKQVRLSQLSEDQRTAAKKMAAAAKKQIKAGVLDAEPEW